MPSDWLSTRLATESTSPIASCERLPETKLKLQFAAISCLGGIVLGGSGDTASLPLIAIFFAAFGFVVVDWLRLFSLPAFAAYIAMGLAAVYCVSSFSDFASPGNRQMTAVAELLVIVQAILMLQEKSPRIYEQLGVFCLLELVVAAVFNNALSYGLLLVPIAIIGCWCLSLMSVLSTDRFDDEAFGSDAGGLIRCIRTNPTTDKSISESHFRRASSWIWLYVFFVIGPAVVLVGTIFFYALPRTADAARTSGSGRVLVGFSDSVHLKQIGQMLQSADLALRIKLTNARSSTPYRLADGIYLRGKVLEHYHPKVVSGKTTATWTALASGFGLVNQQLPGEIALRPSDSNFFDSVNVSITCETMRSSALFSIPPYHRSSQSGQIRHSPSRQIITRHQTQLQQLAFSYPRINYHFGTNAFKDGIQTSLVADQYSLAQDSWLTYDAKAIPSAKILGNIAAQAIPKKKRTSYAIAKQIEAFLSTSSDFSYTLDLSADSLPGYDPIEQFLSVDRQGNCQYFASALAMMLRSQKIPSRLVVGYHTDDYNSLSKHYVARQLHAHAWVEALIDQDQLPEKLSLYGQPMADKYWVRLDPTPGGGGTDAPVSGTLNQTMDMVQGLWDEYVVEMDSTRQSDSLIPTSGDSPMTDSFGKMVRWIESLVGNVRAGKLGGGSLARRQFFSWPAAVIGITVPLLIYFLMRIKLSNWLRERIVLNAKQTTAIPATAFYAAALQQLERLGIKRKAAQTPIEITQITRAQFPHTALPEKMDYLTDAYYRVRFGGNMQHQSLESRAQRSLGELESEVDNILLKNAQNQCSDTAGIKRSLQ